MLYAALYMLQIPTFAVVYDFMPGSFYAPYAKNEEIGLQDSTEVQGYLDKAFTEALRDNKKKNSVKSDKEKLHLVFSEEIPLTTYRVSVLESRELAFNLFVNFLTDTSKISTQYHLHIIAQTYNGAIRDKDNVIHEADNDCFISAGKVDQLESDRLHVPASAAILEFMRQHLLFVKIDPKGCPKINRLIEGFNGDPTMISKSYLRMLYFSSIVTTTIGFGDIIPMTDTARTLVSTEAISGIVLAGLFVSATFSKLERKVEAAGKSL